jgi:hypothetical protein
MMSLPYDIHNSNVDGQRAPDCDLFLVHDDDLDRLRGIGDETVSWMADQHYH